MPTVRSIKQGVMFVFKKRLVFLVLLLVVLGTLNVYAGELKQDSRIQFFCIAPNIKLDETDETVSGFKVGQDLLILIDSPTKNLRSGYEYDMILVMDSQGQTLNDPPMYTIQITVDEHVIFELKNYKPVLKSDFMVPSGLRNKLLQKGIVVDQPNKAEGSFVVFIDDELIHQEKLWFQL